MTTFVTREYIEAKYGSGDDCGRAPVFTGEPLVSDDEFIMLIGDESWTATEVSDALNRTSHKYKRVGYGYVQRRLIQMYNRHKLNKTLDGGHINRYSNNKDWNEHKVSGFKAWMIKHAPNCNKIKLN